jgi:hypothetical protein
MDARINQAPDSALAIDMSLMRQNADNACRMMKTLANRDRLMLLCQLSQGEKCVSELEQATHIQQPTLTTVSDSSQRRSCFHSSRWKTNLLQAFQPHCDCCHGIVIRHLLWQINYSTKGNICNAMLAVLTAS